MPFFFLKFRWAHLFTMTIISATLKVDAVEFMRADSDFGELFIIENRTEAGDWNVVYTEKGIYFKPDSNLGFCASYYPWTIDECYDIKMFHPRKLKIHQCSQKSFAVSIFETPFFKQLLHLHIGNNGISEFQGSGLQGANALNFLNLSQNKLTELPSKAFTNAINLIEIDLSHNQIVSMPSDVFEVDNPPTSHGSHHIHMYEFDYSGRIIPSTTETSYNITTTTTNPPMNLTALRNLEVIHLNNNNLTFIDLKWFSSIPKLATLTLNDNSLKSINAAAVFGSNFALRSLHLQNNQLSARIMDETNEVFLHQLESFDISNNPQYNGTVKINAETINFSNTNSRQCFIPRNAVILRAEHNRIDFVVADELPNTHLQELYLHHNNIGSADFLNGLESLETIDLSHNELPRINASIFANFLNLTVLNISHNKLKSIEFAFLSLTTQLTRLDISGNMLSGPFQLNVKAKGLTVLNITNNNYTSVQHNLREYAPRLRRILLNGNRFNCDDLTSLLLFMYVDYILPITPGEDAGGSENNVRGITCYRPKSSTKSGYMMAKEQLMKTIDDKYAKSEAKLIDLFKNMMTSKTVDN